MSVQTSKASYRRHAYSGPRKSLKRVRGGLRGCHAEESRLKAWRFEETKKPVNEEIVIDNSVITQNTQPRNYARVKPKICLESTYSAPSTSTVTAEPEVEPLEINWPHDDPEIDAFLLIVDTDEGIQESEVFISGDENNVFCPKCNTEVSHTAKGIQEDRTKLLIAKVYHYFKQEYKELKKMYGDLDLTPLSKFRQRTALATGVSETTLLQILKEEEGRNADERREPPQRRRAARKRRRQTDSEETEIFIPGVVKGKPGDKINKAQLQMDPISLDVKTEPRDDEVDTTNETVALHAPADTKRKGKKISRRSDDTSTRQHTPSAASPQLRPPRVAPRSRKQYMSRGERPRILRDVDYK